MSDSSGRVVDRRSFLGQMAAAGGVLGFSRMLEGRALARGVQQQTVSKAARPLRLLVLGGTGFLGPYQISHAVARGHRVAMFNRGKTEPGMFADVYGKVEALLGDRDGDLHSLEGRTWDVVIDNSGYEPAQVRATASLLKNAVGRYLFVSTESAYAERNLIDQDETSPLGMTGVPESQWKGYGPLKALCEKEGRAILGDRFTVVRPAVIVGPGDNTDRFTYWLLRIARGGEVLAPGTPDDPVQLIDVRDVAEFMVHLLETNQPGIFNITGPAAPLTFSQMLGVMRDVTGSQATFTWVDGDFLLARDVKAFSDLPMWQPPKGATAGFMRMSVKRAFAAGLTCRPLKTTVSDLLAWCRQQPADRVAKMRPGLTAERERALLEAWKARR
jgi:2'-hydroxyisoflavone reductase